MESIKLQKYFSDCGVMSRRAAEEVIRQGKVLVNGIPAEPGLRIDPKTDIVEYEGKRLLPSGEEKICVLLNKPRGYLTTLSDDRGRRTVAELIADTGRRLYPVGRLDMDSDGLLLLTDDGELTHRLTHPRHEIPKIYRVTVRGAVTEEQLRSLGQAMILDGYTIQPVETHLLSKGDSRSVLEMRLYEGRNRQIRKMCDEVGLTVLRLSRIAIGELTLGAVPSGKWRLLTAEELAYLRGERKTLQKKKG
ncbi:MAG: rRNA pseudouridine synthase [Ruminococcaceae bacterium]|nr:rRNA pseudouridine synthase [Oscillospiraceae bacterium]